MIIDRKSGFMDYIYIIEVLDSKEYFLDQNIVIKKSV